MGEPVPISLGVRSNPARNVQAGGAQLVNCFAEESGEDAKAPWVIHGTAGLINFTTATVGGGIRARIVVNSVLYVVAGRNVYSVQTSGIVVKLGAIPTDGACYMERNRRIPTQIGIVSGGFFHVIDTGAGTLTQIFDPDLPSPISLSFLNGYGILPTPNGRVFLTGLDDFTTIDGLDNEQAQAFPDDLVRSAVLENELVLYGTDSIEWWQDTGGADFPLSKVHATELGCLAGDSVAKVDTGTRKTLIWVAPDHTVRQMDGYTGVVISTNEIEELIKALHEAGGIDTLRAAAWADSGRFWYSLSCPSWTRTYFSKTGNWAAQQSYQLDRWRVSTAVQFGSRLIAGDYATGQLYTMSNSAYDEAGNPLVMEIVTPPVHAAPYRLKFNGLYLSVAKGVGVNSPDVNLSDPKIMISWSDNSGASYSAERVLSLGRLGQTAKRLQPIYRMGTCGEGGRQFRFRISSPVERLVISAAVDFDKLGA